MSSFLVRFLHIVLARIVPLLVLVLAIFVGWLAQDEQPDARLFATLGPLMKGYAPPTIVGHGKMKGTPPVPDDMVPQPRPANELFVKLLGTEDLMPQNGLGMCCRPTAYDDVLVERTVLWYLLLGGRLIDTAQMYLNHVAIGKGIQEAIRRGVPRKEIFINTKVNPSYFGYNSTKEIVPTYLQELGVDYIDLVLMHAPAAIMPLLPAKECKSKDWTNKECRQQTWKALSEIQNEGMVRNVGVSNFESQHVQDLLELGDTVAPIATNQIQWNPWILQEWYDAATLCQEQNIGITGWNTLGGTLSQHQQVSKVKVLTELAGKYNRTVAQVMLRWAIQTHAVVIPGTGNPNYMKENLLVYEFELTQDEMTSITNLRNDQPGTITSVNFQIE